MAQRHFLHASVIAMTAALFATQLQAAQAQTSNQPVVQEENQMAPPAAQAADGQDTVTLASRQAPCEGTDCLQRPAMPGSPAMAANPGGSVPSEDVVAPPGRRNTGVTVETLPPPAQ